MIEIEIVLFLDVKKFIIIIIVAQGCIDYYNIYT